MTIKTSQRHSSINYNSYSDASAAFGKHYRRSHGFAKDEHSNNLDNPKPYINVEKLIKPQEDIPDGRGIVALHVGDM